MPRDGRRAEIAPSRRVSASAANARALSRHAELEAKRPTYPHPLTFQMRDGQNTTLRAALQSMFSNSNASDLSEVAASLVYAQR